MITDATRLGLIIQIAELFFKNNFVGKASCITRLRTKLDNSSFDYFIDNISQGTFYVASNTPLPFEYVSGIKFYCYSIKLTDLVRGSSHTNPKVRIPEQAIAGKNFLDFWKILLSAWDSDFIVFSVNASDHTGLVHSPDVGSYGIEIGAQTPDNTGRGNGENGINVIPLPSPPVKSPDAQIQTQSGLLSGIDFSNPMVLGGLALAVYFLFLKD
jgi:hypothetical protein